MAPVDYTSIYGKVDGVEPKEKYWLPYAEFKAKLTKLAEWTQEHQTQCNAFCVQVDTEMGAEASGELRWQTGEIRKVVRLYFTKNGLPNPAPCEAAWHALYLEVERENRDKVTYSHVLDFVRFFTICIRDLVTGKSVPVQIAKGLWIPDRNATTSAEWHMEFKPHVEAIQKALDEWETGHMENRVREIFGKCDRNIDGGLEWNNSEVRSFIMEVFNLHGINPPPAIGESHWYQLYAQFEANSDGKLGKEEAIKFAKFLHEEIAKKETDWAHIGHEAPLLVRKNNGSYSIVPQASNGAASPSKRVPSEAAVKAATADWRADMSSVHVTTAKASVDEWHSMNTQQKVHKLFGNIDKDGDGHLEWNNNEIRNLVKKVFEAEGLPEPKIPETVWYRMYRELDVEGTYNLTEDECVEFVKRIYERILHFHQ